MEDYEKEDNYFLFKSNLDLLLHCKSTFYWEESECKDNLIKEIMEIIYIKYQKQQVG